MMEVTILWKEEGRQEGLQQGMSSVILHQVERRLGSLEAGVAERVRGLPPEELERLGDALFDFTSAEDLIKWLQAL